LRSVRPSVAAVWRCAAMGFVDRKSRLGYPHRS
jgi:hypothetical protein